MKKENNSIAVASIIAGAIIVVALLVLAFAGSFGSEKDTVTVQGMSTVEVVPNLVSVSFLIETEGDTSAEANDRNQEIYEDLLVELLLEGISESDIGTEYFNIYPNRQYVGGNEITDGFKAVRSIKVKLSSEDTKKVSDVVDAGIGAGAGVSYINFELSQELQNEYKAIALEEASKDAKVKAEAVARGFDKSVGNLVSVTVDDFGYYPWVMYAAEDGGNAAEARVAAQNINPTTQDVTAVVSATYKLI